MPHDAPDLIRHLLLQMAEEHDTFLFTSESVNEGHPDKLADQVHAVILVIAGSLGF